MDKQPKQIDDRNGKRAVSRVQQSKSSSRDQSRLRNHGRTLDAAHG